MVYLGCYYHYYLNICNYPAIYLIIPYDTNIRFKLTGTLLLPATAVQFNEYYPVLKSIVAAVAFDE